MTTLNRAIKWYINGDLPGGRDALLDGVTANPPMLKPALMQGDTCAIKLYFREPGDVGEDTTQYQLAAGYSLALVGKLSGAINTGSVLFSVTSWTVDGESYAGVLNLDTPALAEAFQAATDEDTLDVSVDIEYRDAANVERLTYRVEIQVCRQVYAGLAAQPYVPMLSPSGYRWLLAVDDEGGFAITRDADPVPLVAGASYFELLSPAGYTWRFTMSDEGELSKTRIT
jgi:hypothetical protein